MLDQLRLAHASVLGRVIELLFLCDSWCQCSPAWAQDMCPSQLDVGWSRRVVDEPARALAPKENPSQYSLISNLSTRNT